MLVAAAVTLTFAPLMWDGMPKSKAQQRRGGEGAGDKAKPCKKKNDNISTD